LAIVKKRPILKGQTNGFNPLRQSACTGFSPFCTLFLAYFCLLSAISSKLMGPDPKHSNAPACADYRQIGRPAFLVLKKCLSRITHMG
jgi:hypothetical protein